MKHLTSFKSLLGAALIALVLSNQAQATIIAPGFCNDPWFVPGTSDPWLAGQPDGTSASTTDTAPGQSPVFVGTFCPGDYIFWKAIGIVSNTPDINNGSGPDGDLNYVLAHDNGVENGIADITAPINSLIGVWFGGGTGTPFYMGESGAAMVPAGQTSLYLGTMDGYEWINNTGGFGVCVGVRHSGNCVPEGGSFAAFYVFAAGLMGLSVVRRKKRVG